MPQLPLFNQGAEWPQTSGPMRQVWDFWGRDPWRIPQKKKQRPIAWKPIPPQKNRRWNGLGFWIFLFHFLKMAKTRRRRTLRCINLGTWNEHIAEIITVIQLTGGSIHFSNIQNHHLLKFRNFGKTPKVFEKILPKIDIGNQIFPWNNNQLLGDFSFTPRTRIFDSWTNVSPRESLSMALLVVWGWMVWYSTSRFSILDPYGGT